MSITKTLAGVAMAAALFLAPASAKAGTVKSLFLGADYNPYISDVMSDLIGSDSRFDLANSGTFNASSGTPTLSYLRSFDSVLVWLNDYPADVAAFTSVLGSYAAGGGRVVLSTFYGQAIGRFFHGAGSINATGFNPLVNVDNNAYTSASLGSYDASSPLMAGVSSLSASTYRGDYVAGLDTGATLVAGWSDGKPLEAINAAGTVVAITLYPNVVTYHHASGDYRTLFANALAGASASAASVPEPATVGLLMVGLSGLLAVRRRSGNRAGSL